MRRCLLLVALLCLSRGVAAQVAYQGCWTNAVNETRALSFKAAANSFMTVDYCRRLAVNRLVPTFGLEWGRECFLDPNNGDLASVTRFGASPNCTMPCSGDPTARCGGDYTVDLYTITAPLPTIIPERNVTYLGCFKDNQLDRRMTMLWVSNSSMTIELCAHIAYSEEWTLFGVQWGRECFGGKDLNHSMSLGVTENCDMQCAGNANETCGGALALDVYEIMDRYWEVPDYESPWEEPKPAPPSVNLLVGSTAACTGAAAASNPACKALQSAAPTAVLSQLLTVLVLLLVVVLG